MIATSSKIKDPVCGMEVDEKSATDTLEHRGKIYSFCSGRCLEKFRADPALLVKPGVSISSATQEQFTSARQPPGPSMFARCTHGLFAASRQAARSAAWVWNFCDLCG